MSPTSRSPFRGRVETAGVVIDPAHVGSGEAHRRVADLWVSGTRLLASGARLVLLFPEPTTVRAELAPGLPLVRNGGWCVPQPGGAVESVADLAPVDLARVIDLDQLEVVDLEAAPPLPEPTAAAVRSMPTRTARPLRSSANVSEVQPGELRRRAELADALARGAGGRGAGLRGRAASKRPMTPMLRRKHARYLDRLTSDFEGRNWDQALRSAIALGGSGTGFRSVRVPGKRRGALRPSRTVAGGGGQVAYEPTVEEHLRSLYRAAATQLAAAGELLRAAFVQADLLNDVTAAIDLLESHGLHREAAELAEARGLDPAVAVRLWWRAGDRARALEVASTRGAYAAAVALLERSGAPSALELRREWMLDRRRAGDHLGALSAAWPAHALRDEALPDIAAAIGAGGVAASEALAHWLEHAPTPEGMATARTILAGGPDVVEARRSLAAALSAHPVSQPQWDRELASAALLAVAQGAGPVAANPFHDTVGRLKQRADPLLVADLPLLRPPVIDRDLPPELVLTARGEVEVHDAVALGTGSVLVALGELGVRLLTTDGRVRARWDVPTHRLVMADHGNRVLLVADRSTRYLLHQLDLPNGRPVPLPALDVMPLDTYDGAQPVLASSRGLEWISLQGAGWQLVWRELTETDIRIHHVARDEGRMAALFTDRRTLQAWSWDLPSLRLLQRGEVEPAQRAVVVATGEVGRLHAESGVASLDWHSIHGHRLTSATYHPTGESGVLVSARGFAFVDRADEATRVAVHPDRSSTEVVRLVLPPDVRPLFRSFGGRITAGHREGRVVVIDVQGRRVTADIAVRA